MRNLKDTLTKPLRPLPVSWAAVLAALALIGFADASYLTIEHYRNIVPPCTVSGCETVLTSAYSSIFGVPVALFGAIFYLIVLIGTLSYVEGRRERPFRAILWLSPVGFVASIWFVFLQAFVLDAYCQYCLVSAGTSTLIFILSCTVLVRYGGGYQDSSKSGQSIQP